MDHAFIKFGATFVLGSALLACPAYALSPLSPSGGSLIVPASNMENEEIMRDKRPDEMPKEEMGGEKEQAPEGAMESGSGDIEDKEIFRDLETGVTPPPGE